MIKNIIINFDIKRKIKLFLMIIFTIFGGILSIIPIKCMERMVDLAILQSSDYIIIITILGVIYMALEVISNYFKYYGEYLVDFFQYEITNIMQINLYEKLMRVDFQELQKHDSEQFVNILVEDTVFLSSNLLKPFTNLLLLIVTFSCGLYYMLNINWILTWLVIPLGLITSISARVIQTRAESNIVSKRNASSKLWKTFSEGLRGMVPLRICRAQDSYRERVKNDSESLKVTNLKQSLLEKVNSAVVSTLFMLTIGIILLLACLFVIRGNITIGGLTAILMYNHMLVDPLVELIDVQQAYIKQKVSLRRINDVMKLKEQKLLPFEKTDQVLGEKLVCHLGNDIVIRNVSINISKGQKVAIVGKTGSGKSTLANILAGLLLPTEGKVRYLKNGVLTNGVPNIGYLYQDGYLFDTTIKQNILFANPSLSDEEYRDIVKKCCLDEIVLEHTESIGENGVRLSGGERKRIRIARALANKQADIYIFDELSTSLDNETARIIVNNILKMLENKICIFIEHNVDIAAMMDKIIMVKNGSII